MKWLHIKMANEEWSSTTPMHDVAEDGFRDHPDATLATVIEHGGWFLTYAKDDTGTARIVGTANDMAIPSEFSVRFWESHRHLPVEGVWIDRQNMVKGAGGDVSTQFML